MHTTFLAYFLVAVYFVMERLLRQGDRALSLQAEASDRGSTRLMLFSAVVEVSALLLAPLLNARSIGRLDARLGWLGILLMVGGLIVRFWAAKTLGEFYTRTLLIAPGQQMIQHGPYQFVRHPGYFGILLAAVGAGLAVTNWVVISIILVSKFVSLSYRIKSEEAMLHQLFGQHYADYQNRTYALIPLIY